MARFCALAQLHLNHLYLFTLRLLAEGFWIEMPLNGATAKIACGDLPNAVTPTSLMVFRERTLTCVMGKSAKFCAARQ